MSIVTINANGVNTNSLISDSDWQNDSISLATATPTLAQFNWSNGDVVSYTGTGFTYSNGDITGGTITGYTISVHGVIQEQITGLNASLAAVMAAAQGAYSGFYNAVQSALIGGAAETIYINGQNDEVYAYGSSNTVILGSNVNGLHPPNDIVTTTTVVGPANGTTTVVFHDPIADYTIAQYPSAATTVVNETSGPMTDGDFSGVNLTTLQFADGTYTVSSGSLAVTASAASVQSNLDHYQSLAAEGKLTGIALTDSGIPTLSVTASQLASDATALNAISGNFDVSITAPATSETIAGVAAHGNTVVFSGTASQYTITPSGDGSTFTISNGTATDQLSHITAVQFSDHTDLVASETPAVAGGISSAQVASLYAAVFGRIPDVPGLAYYENIAATSPSTPITTYAEQFLQSPEYTSNSAHNYPQTSAGDAQFITDTYNNLLHRAPGSTDVAWYQANVINPILGSATPGTAAYATAELAAHAALLADFSQSAEFLNDVHVTAATPSSAQHWLILI